MKAVIGGFLGVGIILYALSENINLFYTPTEIKAAMLYSDKTVRLGGMVVPGSVVYGENLKVQFLLTDFEESVTVIYDGVLPDLFKEGQGIVAQGVLLNAGPTFYAKQVLAKHDENYMPPELGKINGLAYDS